MERTGEGRGRAAWSWWPRANNNNNNNKVPWGVRPGRGIPQPGRWEAAKAPREAGCEWTGAELVHSSSRG